MTAITTRGATLRTDQVAITTPKPMVTLCRVSRAARARADPGNKPVEGETQPAGSCRQQSWLVGTTMAVEAIPTTVIVLHLQSHEIFDRTAL